VSSTWAPGIGVVRVVFTVATASTAPVTTSLTELVAYAPPTSAPRPAASP